MYSEECDLEYRMKISGYKRIIIPGPRIIHFESKSIKIKNSKRIMMEESKFKFLRKYNNKFKILVFKIIYVIIKFLRLIFEKNYNLRENIEYLKNIIIKF